MNIKAIIASLVLGSSSAALASPSVTLSANAQYGTTVVRDHREPVAPAPIYTAPAPSQVYYRDTWNRHPLPPVFRPVTLASDMHFANDGRSFITVGAQMGRFGKLDITSAGGGRTFVQQVYIEFANGQEQVIRNLNRTLTAGECLSLDLDGNRRAIKRIVVYGNPLNRGWNGWRRAAGAFTLTAS